MRSGHPYSNIVPGTIVVYVDRANEFGGSWMDNRHAVPNWSRIGLS